jgi:1-acyl-sn-glycerol-3-phosphate acyltransferase
VAKLVRRLTLDQEIKGSNPFSPANLKKMKGEPGRELAQQRPDNAAMQASELSRRLLIQPGQSVLVLNPPAGYLDSLRPLPDGAVVDERPDGVHDVVQLFAEDRATLELHADDARKALKPGGMLWMSYLNPAALRGSDLTRDHGWGVLHSAGLVAVKQTEVDPTWLALRFEPATEAAATGKAEAVPAADLLPVGPRATLAYRALRLVAVPLFRLLFRFQVSGRERIPRSSTYVVIGNHLGWMDAVTLSIFFPIEPRLHFLADPTGMMRQPLLWALVRATGGLVPVDRAHPGDRRLFRYVDHCLEIGGAIALFPEADFGPREGELLPFKKGFAHFAVDAGVPVVPIALSGTKDLWLGKTIGLRVGEPIPTNGRTVDEVLQLGEQAVAELLPPYHEPPGRKPFRVWLTGLF